MKKLMAFLLTGCMLAASLTGCGAKEITADQTKDQTTEQSAVSEDTGAESDLAYVKQKGVLVVGITEFAPMDYKDENGEWIGFDADMAKGFAKKLGVEIEFVEIDWDNKILELDGKTIDCVWNGMTLTQEVTSSMECTPVKAQSDALMEVAAGTSDAAVIDSLMAAAMVGENTGYEGLTYTVGLNSEEYGVGFRKGSDLAEELNTYFDEAYADGTMQECAETYGVAAAVVAQ